MVVENDLEGLLEFEPCMGENRKRWVFGHDLCSYTRDTMPSCPYMNKGLLVHGLEGDARYECRVKYSDDYKESR